MLTATLHICWPLPERTADRERLIEHSGRDSPMLSGLSKTAKHQALAATLDQLHTEAAPSFLVCRLLHWQQGHCCSSAS